MSSTIHWGIYITHEELTILRRAVSHMLSIPTPMTVSVGTIPPIIYHNPEHTKIINDKGQLQFTHDDTSAQWHKEGLEGGVAFKLKRNLLKYCLDDCKVLLKVLV